MVNTIRQAIWKHTAPEPDPEPALFIRAFADVVTAYKARPKRRMHRRPTKARSQARKYYKAHKRTIQRTRKKWYSKVKRNPTFKRKNSRRR